MAEDTTDWSQFREFRAVELTQSFVLSWHYHDGSLLIDIDLCLCAEHRFYETPRPAENACYRQAIIEFPDCLQLLKRAEPDHCAAGGSIEETIAALGTGRISELLRTADGEYRIGGKFGNVAISADRPLLRIRGLFA